MLTNVKRRHLWKVRVSPDCLFPRKTWLKKLTKKWIKEIWFNRRNQNRLRKGGSGIKVLARRS